MGLAVCIAALVWMGYLWYSANLTSAPSHQNPEELRTLLQLGNEVVDVPQRLVVKWQGAWETKGNQDPYEAAEELSQSLNLPGVQRLTEGGHLTYRVVDTKNGVNVRFNWQEISEDRSYIIIQLEAAGDEQLNALSELQSEYGQAMRKNGIDAEWNASLQGTVKGEQNAGSTMKAVEGGIFRNLDATKAESYEDATTVSNAYEVPSLRSGIQSGGKILNMQVAVHEDQSTGSSRVTIGLPVITIEY